MQTCKNNNKNFLNHLLF